MNDAVLTNKRQGTLADDMLLTFLLTFTFAAYSYEARLDNGMMSIFRHVLLAVFLFTWIIISVKNGLNKKTGFALYSAAFWLIPQLIILLFYHGPEFFRHSVIMYTLSEFFSVLTTRPAEILGKYCGVPVQMSFILVLLGIFGAFFTGFSLSDNRKSDTGQS